MSKKVWHVPLTWTMYGYMEIEAESCEEAISIALAPETNPPDGYYLDESTEVDEEGLELIENL